MSKDKISAQDIIDALAEKTDITKHSAEDFFKAFILTIEEALLANDLVKIKNLGTFRLNWIAPRKSVNVQTGEGIEIDGYYKVVFAPDKDLKELVNKPFSHLEPVVLDEKNSKEKNTAEADPLASLTEQADAIKGLLSEIQSMSGKKEEKTPVKEKTTVEKNVPKEKPAKQKMPAAVNRPDKTIVAPVKKKRTWLWIVLVIVLLLGIGVCFYFFCMPVQHWVNKNFFGYDTATYDAAREAREQSNLAEEWFRENEEVSDVSVVEVDDFQKAFDNRFDNREVIDKVELGNGNRLAYLAEKYYGSPYFWVYIYEANSDRISDPNKVQSGTVVDIPKVDPLLIDLDNPRSMEKVSELREKYLK